MYALTKSRNNDVATLARDFFGFDPFFSNRAPLQAAAVRTGIDFYEADGKYHLEADLPGISEEDLELTVHEGVLSLSAKRTSEEEKSSEEEGNRYYLRERSVAEFARKIRLPKDASVDDIEAKLTNGVLTVKIGKTPELQARRIQLTQ